jgi:hypothetical protein
MIGCRIGKMSAQCLGNLMKVGQLGITKFGFLDKPVESYMGSILVDGTIAQSCPFALGAAAISKLSG